MHCHRNSLLDGYRHRMPLSERWSHLKSLHQKWSGALGVMSVTVGYEIYGQQADIEVLQQYMEREKYWFALAEVNTPRQGGHAKEDRIERLEPDLRQGRFLLPGIVHAPEFKATTASRCGRCGLRRMRRASRSRVILPGRSSTRR